MVTNLASGSSKEDGDTAAESDKDFVGDSTSVSPSSESEVEEDEEDDEEEFEDSESESEDPDGNRSHLVLPSKAPLLTSAIALNSDPIHIVKPGSVKPSLNTHRVDDNRGRSSEKKERGNIYFCSYQFMNSRGGTCSCYSWSQVNGIFLL